MKLLSRTEASSKKKLENESLIESNIRLRKYHTEIVQKLNTVKEDYEPEKLEKLREFETFCRDLDVKRETLLKELAQWQKLLADTKEIYYGYIVKADELAEKEYRISEETKKLNLREAFISDLEQKWQAKQ